MPMSRIRRVSGRAGWRTLRVGAAVLAAAGALGTVPGAAGSAAAQDLNWTKPAPAVHPVPGPCQAMADDAATGDVVLFGGSGSRHQLLNDTWTWNGSTWTQQHPAVQPGCPVLRGDGLRRGHR